jgi:pyruvate kinase
VVKSNTPVKIPGSLYQKIPILREEDKEKIEDIAVKHHFDYIVIPCVQTGKDLADVREALGKTGEKIHIIAKICNIDAVQNFPTILKYTQGIVILRNELSVDMEPEKLVIAQKWMIQAANKAAVPVFIQS